MELSEFYKMINKWKYYRFTDSGSRDKIFHDYEVRKVENFSDRFPSRGLHIDLDHPFVASKFLYLFSIIDYPTSPPDSTHLVLKDYDRLIEAREHFKDALSNIISLLGGISVYRAAVFGIYNRESFELYYNLKYQ